MNATMKVIDISIVIIIILIMLAIAVVYGEYVHNTYWIIVKEAIIQWLLFAGT
jgi:hypothetical protein